MLPETPKEPGGPAEGTPPEPGGVECGVGSGGRSLVDMGEPRGEVGAPGGGSASDGAAEEGACTVFEETGDAQDSDAPAEQAGPKVPRSPNTRFRSGPDKLTRADIARAITYADGDLAIAAAALGVTVKSLHLRIDGSPQLSAMFKKETKVPTQVSVITRNKIPESIDLGNNALGEQIARQNQFLMREGFRRAGIGDETINKLQVLENLAPSAGEFLVASLDITHRMMVLQSVRLFEAANDIKTNYLDDATLDDADKIEWHKIYNDINDQIGKTYDRTLIGTQAMAKMLGTDEEDTKKKKPGFKPLQRAK